MTNALTALNNTTVLTMSSREIAEQTGKDHFNVMRDIRNMLVELHGEGGFLSFEDTYIHPQNGQKYPEFRLPKDLTITLISGYNVKMRHAISKHWMEPLSLTFEEKVKALTATHRGMPPKLDASSS